MSEPSPTPWKIDNGYAIQDANGLDLAEINGWDTDSERDDANAALIVRAVNAHAELLAAATEICLAADAVTAMAGHEPDTIRALRAAVIKAKSETP